MYVMAMMLVRDLSGTSEFDFTHGNAAAITIDPSNTTNDSNGVNSAMDEYRAWRLAQWAINIADFPRPGWDHVTV